MKIINKKNYLVKDSEFLEYKHNEFNYLTILPEVGILERHIGILTDIAHDIFQNKTNLLVFGNDYGNFVQENCSSHFESVYTIDNDMPNIPNSSIGLVYTHQSLRSFNFFNHLKSPFILTHFNLPKDIEDTYVKYELSRLNTFDSIKSYFLYVPVKYNSKFLKHFYYYFTNKDPKVLEYNNLIHLCVMVKNGGDLFEKMLLENLHLIDRWTILDTGSTDNTIEIINRVLENKKGRLFQEPFINFRDSRNRCLDLAGKTCKFNLMLDDTYIVKEDLRTFLEVVRGDQFADSFSMIIKSDDMEYCSNRITKSANELRYIYKIHEVITNENNTNVIVPITNAFVYDERAEYMEKRTMDRKQYDLKLLFEEIEENPDDPRNYYYVAQTYNCINEHEKAAEYFLKRAFHKNVGFLQEKVDSLFEAARCYNFKLNRPWNEVERLYQLCYEWEPERPDAVYFIGINYYLQNNYDKAYYYLKKAFEIGFPLSKQYSLKPTLSFHFVPKFLAELCLKKANYNLGLKCTTLFLQKNDRTSDEYHNIESMHKLFEHITKMPPLSEYPIELDIPVITFIVDGGYSSWSGSDILKNGVGGSETWAIETARYIKRKFDVEVIVFCNCETSENFEGVKYKPLSEIYNFFTSHKIHTCIISRFTEYLSLAYEGFVENVFLVLHDLGPIGNVIPINKKLKNVVCLTEWHKQFFLKSFPTLEHLTTSHHYGVDFELFQQYSSTTIKEPYRFIYSSFPNRGLIVLLKIWKDIKTFLPQASLHLYCDVNGRWVNESYPDEMKEIRKYLWNENGEYIGNKLDIVYNGWVSKKELVEGWSKADIWFYPCKFAETFCLTALEAAVSKTFVITNGLAALENTVGDRGIVIPGNVTTTEWQQNALSILKELFSNTIQYSHIKSTLVSKNFDWSLKHTWKERGEAFFERFIRTENNADNTNDTNSILLEEQSQETELFINQIGKDDIVLDIGSFTGENTIVLSNHAKKVYAFEPYKPSFEKCVEKIEEKNINNIVLENKGVGKYMKTENKIYFDRFDPKISNLQLIGNFSSSESLKTTVDITTIDDHFVYQLENSKEITVINIDIPNKKEINHILEGGKQLISLLRPVIILPFIENFNENENIPLFVRENYTISEYKNNRMLCVYDENKKHREIYIKTRVNDLTHWNIIKIGAFRGNSSSDLTYQVSKSEKDMRNIFVEPVTKHFNFLFEFYKNNNPNNNHVFINKAVDNVSINPDRKLKLYVLSDDNNDYKSLPSFIEQMTSFDKDHYKNQGYNVNMNEVEVDVIDINEIVQQNNVKTLDLLYVDTEGKDYDILNSLCLETLKPAQIMFTHKYMTDDEYALLINKYSCVGYRVVNIDDKDVCLKLI
jgi:FkbM family methyltransferase